MYQGEYTKITKLYILELKRDGCPYPIHGWEPIKILKLWKETYIGKRDYTDMFVKNYEAHNEFDIGMKYW